MEKPTLTIRFWNISSGGTGTSESFVFLKVHSVHFFVYVALSFCIILMTPILTPGGVDEKATFLVRGKFM